MAIIEPDNLLGLALYGQVKRKVNNTRHLRAVARSVTRRAPEVMLKITGFGRGGRHVMSHLEYITRKGKISIENDRGELFNKTADIKEFLKEWNESIGDGRRHKNQRDTMHMILSMPASTDPEVVRAGVKQFTSKIFGGNHEYIFALHTDEPHPHCHVSVKMLGFDGRRLNPRKADLQSWREHFAEAIRDQGVEAEATPRRVRGVVRKAKRQAIYHIEKRGAVPRVQAMKVKEAADNLSQAAAPISASWEARSERQQIITRRIWENAANALTQSTEATDKLLAKEILQFVREMPAIETERQQIKRTLLARFSSKTREPGRGGTDPLP